MTEVPEHLMQRSKERRAALGLGGDDAGESSAPVPATTSAGPAGAEAAPKVAAAAAAPPAEDKKLEAERAARDARKVRVNASLRKNRIPIWAAPVVFVLPVWGMLYAGTFGERAHEEPVLTGIELGAEVYSENCASCHGALGEGKVGPQLAEGEVLLTFPEEADHLEWVENGSQTRKGDPYGDPARAGGQRVANGGMPAFADTLSAEEIDAVVLYEREGLE